MWRPVLFTNTLDRSTTDNLCFKFVFFQLPIVDASDAFFCKAPNVNFLVDVTFNVKGIKMRSHSAVVTSSPVFAAMIESGKVEDGTKCVDINDTEPEVFEQILRYLYTNEVLKLRELVLPLLVAADRFQIDSLKEICELLLSLKLNSFTVIHRLIVARKHSAADLLEASMCCLTREWQSVFPRPDLDTLLHFDPDLFTVALGRIASQLKNKEKASFSATLRKLSTRLVTCNERKYRQICQVISNFLDWLLPTDDKSQKRDHVFNAMMIDSLHRLATRYAPSKTIINN
jgi:BTB/POZ domain